MEQRIAAVRAGRLGILTFVRKCCSHGGRVLMCSFHVRSVGIGMVVYGSGMLMESWLWLRQTATGVHVGEGSNLFGWRRRGLSMSYWCLWCVTCLVVYQIERLLNVAVLSALSWNACHWRCKGLCWHLPRGMSRVPAVFVHNFFRKLCHWRVFVGLTCFGHSRFEGRIQMRLPAASVMSEIMLALR